jgi:O6-methylguanine-DNA--protein-cysteine methyltransferase
MKSLKNKLMVFTNRYESPFGGITLASDGDALTGLWFEGQTYFGCTLSSKNDERQLPVFAEIARKRTARMSAQAVGDAVGHNIIYSLNGEIANKGVIEEIKKEIELLG